MSSGVRMIRPTGHASIGVLQAEQMLKQGGVNESFTVEQCPLCNVEQSAQSCAFRTKPTDELLQCSETRNSDDG